MTLISEHHVTEELAAVGVTAVMPHYKGLRMGQGNLATWLSPPCCVAYVLLPLVGKGGQLSTAPGVMSASAGTRRRLGRSRPSWGRAGASLGRAGGGGALHSESAPSGESAITVQGRA
jgi:hypothetical protein